MSIQIQIPDTEVQLRFGRKLTPTHFHRFCLNNPELNVELEPDGTVTIMSPLTPSSGRIEALFIRVDAANVKFDSNSLFRSKSALNSLADAVT